MSGHVNQHQVPSTSPARSRRISAAAVDNEPTSTRPGNSITSGPTDSSLRSTPVATDGPNRGSRYPLHEFRSLLEAAQRIANSAPFDTEGHRWREDDQPEPIIHLNRRRAGELPERRVPLTRHYSGRPHVPGEDSGSEAGIDDSEMDLGTSTGHDLENVNNPAPRIRPTQAQSESHLNAWSSNSTSGTSDGLSHTRSDHVRTRDRQQEEEEHELLEQALARSREVRSRFEADNQRSTLVDARRARYSTTGPSPTRESFYDWAPEPSTITDPASSTPWSRTRAASVRRWRPAERLQDYASNHARRDSLNNAPQTSQVPITEPPTVPMESEEGVPMTRTSASGLGSHDDVVDRVERALQQYRIARRALRAQNEDSVVRIPPTSDNNRVVERTLGNRPLLVRPGLSDILGAAQNVSDRLDSMEDLDSDGQTSNAPTTSGVGDNVNGSATIRSVAAGREGRQDPLRQRIREQVRERRRHVLQSWAQENTRESLARGPLFESTPASQSIRTQADPRRALEKIRLDESRAKLPEFRRAKAALHYLALLREPDVDEVRAWTVAAELGLHNQTLQDEPKTNLPMSVTCLPYPSFSSWLEPGMIWTGIQDAHDAGETATRSSQDAIREASTSREQRERVDLASRQYESFRARVGSSRDPLERTLLGSNSTTDPLHVARNSMQVLEDAERSLSSMLERSEELLRENERQLRDNEEQLRQNRERLRDTDRRLTLLDEAVRRRARQRAMLSGPTRPAPCMDSDWWNVKVTLHSVDERHMTVSGTMTASHKLNHSSSSVLGSSSNGSSQEDPVGTSMDSFFTGEIIDFTHHGLDTLPSMNRFRFPGSHAYIEHQRQQDQWRVGGPETDLNYWAGIGPFKHEVDCALRAKEMENNMDRAMQVDEKSMDQQSIDDTRTVVADNDSDSNVDSTDKTTSANPYVDNSVFTPLSEDEKFSIKMETMARLLSDTDWLKENIGAQGWILMRWKERCFVAPGTDPNPDARRPWIPTQSRMTDSSGHMLNEDASLLSVSDLIANDRLRRRRERDTRVWSTNAAERDELSNTGGLSARSTSVTESGVRQPTWGLTISGFYYVALERKTGRIEALYYDCGSTPFQKLKMSPQTLYSTARTQQLGNNQDVPMATEQDLETGLDISEKPDLSGIAGLKTNFNIVEFR